MIALPRIASARILRRDFPMSHRAPPSRPHALVLAAVFAVCGWIGSSSGRLSIAAIADRDHVLELTLGDGHLDLVREHMDYGDEEGVADASDHDHVIHLCHSIDSALSRTSAHGPGSYFTGPVAADSIWNPIASARRSPRRAFQADIDLPFDARTVLRL